MENYSTNHHIGSLHWAFLLSLPSRQLVGITEDKKMGEERKVHVVSTLGCSIAYLVTAIIVVAIVLVMIR